MRQSDPINLYRDTKPHRHTTWPLIPLMLIGMLYATWLWMPYYHWATLPEPAQISYTLALPDYLPPGKGYTLSVSQDDWVEIDWVQTGEGYIDWGR